MQLTKGLSEVNRKHEALKAEMERIASVLPSAAAAANRAKEALSPLFPQDAGDYDRQMIDFALESAGGRVIDTGDTVEHVIFNSFVGYFLYALTSMACRGYECFSARALLKPGAHPGECWAFKGSRGEVTVRLLGTIYVSAISLEHIPPNISPTKEISSAPRLVQLEGINYRGDQDSHDFGSFEYKKDGPPIQYFEVRHPASNPYNLVRLRIITNWGHPVYTCVYRFRVHGELAHGQGNAPKGITTNDDEIMQIDNE